ncbi:MAG: hypothetical protein GX994_07270 [Firmicutes bacterium]|nr:hypothetical protein [Bacillota bacterium]
MSMTVNITNASAPIIEIPTHAFTLKSEIYERRLSKLRKRMAKMGLDAIAIYADREHTANFSYITGFGPRFEESLLLILPSGKPKVLLGTENLNMVDYAGIDLEGIHFPSFGLIGQPRENTLSLKCILKSAGLERGMSVGTVGWKYYSEVDGCPSDSIEIPHFLVEALVDAVGDTHRVKNVTHIFMSPIDGLRTRLEPEQVIVFEYAACLVSKSMMNLMDSVEVGISEMELGSKLQSMGMPLSAHPMVSVGDKARFGLTSPSARKAQLGDFLTSAFGIEGALCCRAAYIARSEKDISAEGWLENIAFRYFRTAVEWYESIGIGVEGGQIFDMVETRLPRSKFGWVLNPGHLIAADEWVSTPFMDNSRVKLQSGNYMQFDLIISPKEPYFGANLEDGIVLADQALRDEIRSLSPQTWRRFERRREYISRILGIQLREEVLPMSDLAGYYRPFLLNKDLILTVK